MTTRRRRFCGCCERLNEELGVTLLMVTHDADAAAIAGRQLRLEHGKLSRGGAGRRRWRQALRGA